MSNARNIASIAGEDVLNASNQIVPVYACRAWVNFDGTLDENQLSLTTGENVYIRDAGNVSSVYFNTTGNYTINFEIDMPDENYSVAAIAQRNGSYATNANTIIVGLEMDTSSSLSTSGFDITTHYHTTASQQNPIVVCVSVFC
jgi:hypothetical protein